MTIKYLLLVCIFYLIVLSGCQQQANSDSNNGNSLKSITDFGIITELTHIIANGEEKVSQWLKFSTTDDSWEREFVISHTNSNMINDAKNSELGIASFDINNDGLNDIIALYRLYDTDNGMKPLLTCRLFLFINNGENHEIVWVDDVWVRALEFNEKNVGIVKNSNNDWAMIILNGILYGYQNRGTEKVYTPLEELAIYNTFNWLEFGTTSESEEINELIYERYLNQYKQDLEQINPEMRLDIYLAEVDLNCDGVDDLIVVTQGDSIGGSAGNSSMDIFVKTGDKYDLLNVYIFEFENHFQRFVLVENEAYGTYNNWRYIVINGVPQIFDAINNQYISYTSL